jgi:diguanylate cyclase
MRLSFGKKADDMTTEQLQAALTEARERNEFLLAAATALVASVKEFSFGLREINAEVFSREMIELLQAVQSDKSPAALKRILATKTEVISAFIQREKAYLDTRESEYQKIILMLRQSLATMIDDNQAFSNTISDHNSRMEETVYLDDIRRIREQVRDQVSAVKTTISQKRASDLRQVDKLSREVDSLRSDLERVTDISKTDPLTGAFNRMAFDINLQHMIDNHTLTKTRFSLLMCDIDNFKRVNDTYGHPVGDRVLKSLVAEAKAFFRDKDLVARYGGEEFAVLLPSAPLSDARKRAALFCQKLAASRFRIRRDDDDETITYTVSIGVSEIHKDDTAETMIERADRALYLAKHSGKNRAVDEQELAKYEKRTKVQA